MNQFNRTKDETLILRLRLDGDHHGQHIWRGYLIPKMERQVGSQSLKMMAIKIVYLLGEGGADENSNSIVDSDDMSQVPTEILMGHF